MCDVCNFEGVNYKLINFPKNRLIRRPLYTLNKGHQYQIVLCYIHDIELFVKGERRFFDLHPKLLAALNKWPEKFSKKASDDDTEIF
jgi:hypothetical protein